MVLLKMKETAEAYLGSKINDAVVTVPSRDWGSMQVCFAALLPTHELELNGSGLCIVSNLAGAAGEPILVLFHVF